jgi:hypothetical protein
MVLSVYVPDVKATVFAMFANIIGAAECKVKCLKRGDSVWYSEFKIKYAIATEHNMNMKRKEHFILKWPSNFYVYY